MIVLFLLDKMKKMANTNRIVNNREGEAWNCHKIHSKSLQR